MDKKPLFKIGKNIRHIGKITEIFYHNNSFKYVCDGSVYDEIIVSGCDKAPYESSYTRFSNGTL